MDNVLTDGYLYNGEQDKSLTVEQRGVMSRIRSFFKSAPQDRPDLGRYAPWRDTLLYGSNWNLWNRATDYAREAGPLDQSSLVMSIVNDTGIAIAEALPSVRKKDAKGKWEVQEDHDLADLIKYPNPFNIWADYCKAGSLSWWIDGNWYMKMVRDLGGKVVELWYLPHHLVQERWPNDGKSPEVPISEADNPILTHYQYDAPGEPPVLIRRADMLHIKNGVDLRNPRRGIGAFGSVFREICGDNAVAAFSATLMRNMGMVPYLLAPKEKETQINETQAEAIKAKWIQRTSGENIGQPLVNAIPLEVTKLGLNPQELDLSKLRIIFESRVAAVSRYPAAYLQFLVGLENGTSYASYKQAREQAFEQVVIPIMSAIAPQITRTLMPEFEKDRKTEFFFDTSDVRVLQEDMDAKFKREEGVFRAGGTTLDEYLTEIGKAPIGSPLGDVRMVPSMCTPMSPEKLTELAADMTPPPTPQPIDPASMAKFADVDRTIAYLEAQSKEFDARLENRQL